jgi:prephenate dehydrogenase
MADAGRADAAPARLGIVGLGLIGGSIAAAVRAAWPDTARVGVDHDGTVRTAAGAGLVDEVRDDIADLADCDLIVLAVPVPAILDLLSRLRGGLGSAVVTDVGSTKRQIVEAGRAVPRFVGGHPIAGAERGGLERARPDLFAGRTWAVTVAPDTDPDAATRVERFAAGLGATPVRMTPDAHDRAVAYLSHVPQLVAVALMNAAEQQGVTASGLAGQGFRDMTRLAASPGALWQGILDSNHDFVREALGELQRHLPAPDAGHDPAWLRHAFDAANQARRRTDGTGR